MQRTKFKLKELCLEVGDKCLLNCLHCSGSCSSISKNILSLDHIKRTVKDFASLGGECLEISGGEPLLHPSLLDTIEFASENKLESILYTSGNVSRIGGVSFIDTTLASDFQAAGLNKVVVNLQGAFPTTHDTITQIEGSFSNAVRSIRVLKSLGFWIGIHFVPMSLNCAELKALCLFCNELLVDEIGILRFVPQGRGHENRELIELSHNEFREFNALLAKLTHRSSTPNIRVGCPMDFRFVFDTSFTRRECTAGMSRCSISSNGKVTPCPAFKRNGDAQFVAGNVKFSSLTRIWYDSPVWHNFRYFNYEGLDGSCKNCAYLHECKGGCKAQRLLAYNDISKTPDPCCPVFATPMAVKHPSSARGQEQSSQSQT